MNERALLDASRDYPLKRDGDVLSRVSKTSFILNPKKPGILSPLQERNNIDQAS